MKNILIHLRGLLIAIVALALSSSLAFAAQPASPGAAGRANAATHGDKTGASGDEEAAGDEDTEESEETEEPEGSEEEGAEEEGAEEADNCLTDPTALTPEELAAMTHGSVVCWAAQQETWPEWFANHGKFVSCWAHQGKADAPSCTEAPVEDAAAATHGNGKASGKTNANGKGKGHKDTQ